MSDKTIRILLIEDNPGDARLIREVLADASAPAFDLTVARRLSSGLKRLVRGGFDVLLLDLLLPDSQGLDTFVKTYARAPGIPIIVLSGLGDKEMALEAVQKGAQDFLVKDEMSGGLLVRAIRYAIERKRAEEALKESEEKFRTLAEQSPNMIFINKQGRVVYANERCAQVTRYTRDEFYAASFDFLTLVAPEDRELIEVSFAKHKTGQEIEPYEYTLITKDGERLEVIHTTRLIDYEGERAILGTVTDITKRKRAEEALNRERDLVRRIAETSPAGITMVDRKGQITFANARAEQVLGLTRDEIGKRTYNDPQWHITDYDGNPFPDEELPFRRVITTGQPVFDVRHAIEWPDGQRVLLSINAAPLFDEAGQVDGMVATVEDVTERKRAEEALQESEVRYRRLFEGAVLGVFQSTPEGGVITVNPAFARMFGYESPADVIASVKNVATDIFAEPQRRSEIMRLMAEKPGSSTFENLYRRKDGSTFTGNLHIWSVKDADDRLRHLEGFIEDITERKQAEEALKESEKKYRSVVDNIQDVFYRSDKSGRLSMSSPSGAGMFGYASVEEMLGLPLETFWLDPRGREAAVSKIREMGGISDYEATFVRRDGTPFPASISAHFYYDEAGTFQGTEGIIRDITERKRAEEALRESEERFRQVLESLQDVAYRRNLQTDTYDYMSPAQLHISGYTAEEILSMPTTWVLDRIHPDDRDHVVRALEESLAGGQRSCHMEYRFKCKDGQYCWMSDLSTIVWDAQECPLYRIGTVRDITERRRAEEALRESEEQYRAMFYSMGSGVAVYEAVGDGADFVFKDFNPAAERISRISRDKVIGRPLLDLFPNMDRFGLFAALQRVYRTGQPEHLPAAYYKDQYREGWRDNFIYRLPSGNVVAIYDDVGERKRAEEALRESEARYRAMIESQVDLISRYLPDTTLTFVNDAYCKFFGKTREELIGHSYLFMIAPEFREQVRKETEDLFKSPRPLAGEYLNYRYDGKECWIQWVVQCISDENGRVVELQAVGRDITERKQAEAQLERNLHETRVRFEIGQALVGAETEDEVLDVLIQHAGLYPQALATVFTFDRAGDELAIILRRHNSFESGLVYVMPIGARFPASRFPSLSAYTANQLFVSDNVFADERVDPASRELIRQVGAASYLAVPVAAGNDWLGTIYALAKSPSYFDEEKQHLYLALAEQGAVALHDARLRETIRESQQRLSLLVQQSPLAVIEWNRDLQVISWNPAAERIFGYPPEEALGHRLADLIAPEETRSQTDQVWQAALAQEGGTHSTSESLTKDGRSITCAWFNAPLVGADGQVIGVASLVEDITVRRRAEEALRASEERFRALVETSSDWIWEVNEHNVYTYVSPKVQDLLGYEPAEVLGRTPFDLMLPEEAERVRTQMTENSHARRAFAGLENANRRKDGRVVVLETSGVPIFDANGVFRGYRGIDRNITERRRAEEERERLLAQVQEQAQRVQQIMDTVPEGVLLLDSDYHVVLANPLGRKDLAALAGAQVGDTLTHLGDRPLAELLTPPPRGLWHEVTTANRFFQTIARPIEDRVAPKGWVLVIRDMTQQYEFERRAQQQERLAAIGQLAAGIAHDFNNIVAVITLYAGMLAHTPDLPTRIYERMEIIHQQARRASDLIQQILDFSRRAVLERRPMDLTPFLKEQVKLLERTLPESIRVDFTYGKDEYTVNADPTRMQQVIMNLAVNARDAMPEGGRLRITLERMRVQPGEPPPLAEISSGEWVTVSMADTGSGIPPDVLPHIYEPFFTTKSPGQGAGLGLAQVYGIVRQHESFIDLKTQVGEGTAFTLYLPALAPSQAETPAPKTEQPIRGHGETILVVEDESTARRALVESLEMLNYRVLEAANGWEALAIVQQRADSLAGPGQDIALVLSDVVMPEMGGRALLHALREKDPRIKIVMLSGHPLGEELESLRAQGLDGWLSKPASIEKLADVVAQALEDV